MKKTIAALSVVVLALALFAGPAFAQSSGYPGPTTTAAAQETVVVQEEGVLSEGQTRSFSACGFASGSSVAPTFDGQALPAQEADASGCVYFSVEVLSESGTRACGGVKINGAEYTGQAGSNAIVSTGTGANGAARTLTNNFSIQCGEPVSVRQRGEIGPSALARTGFTALRWLAVGLALLAIGAGAIAAERRRMARRSA